MYFLFFMVFLHFVLTASNQVDIILHRDKEGDYLKNAWSALCQQYKNTIWVEDEKLCKCSTSKSTFYSHPSSKELGCYLGNEAGSCSIFLTETPSSVHITNVTEDQPSVNLGPFDSSIEGCKRPSSERWDKDEWQATKDINVKIKAKEVAFGFAKTDIPSYVQGALFKAWLSCPAGQNKCFLFKVRGAQILTSAVAPTTQPPLQTTSKHSTAPSGQQQNKDDEESGMSQTTAFILGAIVAVLIVAMVIGGLFFYRMRQRKKVKHPNASIKGSRKSNFNGDDGDNFYEDIGNGLYADIADKDLYLNPLETMKRPPILRPTPAILSPPSFTLSSENRYGGIDVRSSDPPSEATIQRFNIHQPQPSIPKTEKAKQNTHSNLEDDERYSSLEPSEMANINGGYVSLNRAATLEDQYVAPGHIEPPSSYQALDRLDNIPGPQTGDTYDVVGTVSMDNSGESTYDCVI